MVMQVGPMRAGLKQVSVNPDGARFVEPLVSILTILLSIALIGRADANDILASDSVRILGVSLEVSPTSLAGVPRNVPLLFST